MKRITGLLALSLSALLAAPALAQDRGRGSNPPPPQGEQGGQRGGQTGDTGQGRGQTPAPTQGRVVEPARGSAQQVPNARQVQADEALRQLETRGAQTSSEDLERLSQALRQSLDDARGKERIQAAITELQDAARQGRLSEDDVRALRTEAQDTRFDQAFAELMKKAEARQATSADFDRLAAMLVARQQAAQGTELDLRQHQTRLAQAIESLKAKHATGALEPGELRALRANANRARLDGAFERLAQRAPTKSASRADFARARDLLRAQSEEAGVEPQESALAKRLQAALDALEKRTMAGEGVTREEFVALRDQLVAKAREAGSAR